MTESFLFLHFPLSPLPLVSKAGDIRLGLPQNSTENDFHSGKVLSLVKNQIFHFQVIKSKHFHTLLMKRLGNVGKTQKMRAQRNVNFLSPLMASLLFWRGAFESFSFFAIFHARIWKVWECDKNLEILLFSTRDDFYLSGFFSRGFRVNLL